MPLVSPHEPTLYSSLNTQDAMLLAREWLETCLERHDTSKTLKGATLPTRLLSMEPGSIRLCLSTEHSNEKNGHTEYATLSHCWGPLLLEILVTRNFQSFPCSILPQALPKPSRMPLKYVVSPIYAISGLIRFAYIFIDTKRNTAGT